MFSFGRNLRLADASIASQLLVCVFACLPANSVVADDTAAGLAFFENKIRPVLVEHCYECHSAAGKVKGGLLLDRKSTSLAGGESGAAVIPGNAEESLLLSAIRYEDYEMPPSGRLPAVVIADFEKWIRMGAPDPRVGEAIVRRDIDITKGRDFWAFRPVQPTAVPNVSDSDWPRDEVDHFVLARLEAAELPPVGDVDQAAWLRRVSFDLTGLPPTEQALHDFLANDSPTTRAAVVDGMLDLPHFGERWGRHWLDVARYAESTGRTRNYPYPFAWRYRDYVVQSLNKDKRYDQFIVEQIAGDLLPAEDLAHRDELSIATGYLAVGSPDLNERNAQVFKMDMVADQIDTISRSMLGLTVGCARCHDHKFDPIPTEDYYALAGIFASTKLLNGYANRVGGNNKARGDLLIKLGQKESERAKPEPELTEAAQLTAGLNGAQAKKLLAAKKQVDNVKKRMEKLRKDSSLGPKAKQFQLAAAKKQLQRKNRQFNQLKKRLGKNQGVAIKGPACLGVREAKQIADCSIHVRGDTNNLSDAVPRGFLQVIQPTKLAMPKDQSGRLQLAQWIASAEHPLTARVFVNRVWYHLFGQGLVRTVDNFGEMGSRPSHPQLLDYLATEFVANGWSTKQLIRKLVLSRTYGLDVIYDANNANVDAENTLLWRMNSRRLEYEAMRDTMLFVSGDLQTSPPKGSPVQKYQLKELGKSSNQFKLAEFRHRSVYLPVVRSLLPEEMSYFDFPESSEARGARDVTTVPTQSLFLLNNPFVIAQAGAAAKRLLNAAGQGEDALAEDDKTAAVVAIAAYRKLFTRDPLDSELQRMTEFVSQRSAALTGGSSNTPSNSPTAAPTKKNAATPLTPQEQAWSEAIQAMFASAEFRYR